MKFILLSLLLVATFLAADAVDPQPIRLCGAQLAEALNIVCLRKDELFTEPTLINSIYKTHLKHLLGTRNDANPNRRPSLVEHCCVKSCHLLDLVDYCPT